MLSTLLLLVLLLTAAAPAQEAQGHNRTVTGRAQSSDHLDAKADFGCKGDGIADDTACLQAAIWASMEEPGDNAYRPVHRHPRLYLGSGRFKLTDTLKTYYPGEPHQTWMPELYGDGSFLTGLEWHGPANKPAIQVYGYHAHIHDLAIGAYADWTAAIDYTGDAAHTNTTWADLERVAINCQHHYGDGMWMGSKGFQADHVKLEKYGVERCSHGWALKIMDSNALDTLIIQPEWNFNHGGVMHTTGSTGVTVVGGEIDDTDIGFWGGSGGVSVQGVRSEQLKRLYYDGAGVYAAPHKFDTMTFSNIIGRATDIKADTKAGSNILAFSKGGQAALLNGFVEWDYVTFNDRQGHLWRAQIQTFEPNMTTAKMDVPSPVTASRIDALEFGQGCTLALTKGSNAVTQSPGACFDAGRDITIRRANPDGSDFHSQITSCRRDGVTCTLRDSATVTQAGLRAYYGDECNQQHFIASGSNGPLTLVNNYFGSEAPGGALRGCVTGNNVTIVGNAWVDALHNPFGIPPGSSTPSHVLSINNLGNFRAMPTMLPADSLMQLH